MSEKLNKHKEINKGNLSRDKNLGIVWDENTNVSYFSFNNIENFKLKTLTQCNILNIVPSFYNPLGVIQPIKISLKMLLEELFRHK